MSTKTRQKLSVADLLPKLVDQNGNPLGGTGRGLILPGEDDHSLTLPKKLASAPAFKSEEEYAKDENSLVDMIEKLVKSRTRIPPDLRVDDRDAPEFANFYEFCFSKQGLNQKPFARQMALLLYLFAEVCPRCSKDMFWDIHKIPVDFDAEDFPSRITIMEFGVCPKCSATRSELYRNGELRVPQELDACIGQRAGKSAMLSMGAPYIIHKWMKMSKPVETLGLLSSGLLTGSFVGLTFAKAIELLWTPITTAIENSPWFQNYHSILDHYGEKLGVELYRNKDTFLSYPYKNMIFSPSGPNKRTLRGATRLFAFIDELGWFPHGEENEQMERASANEVYVSLDRSLFTVRNAARELLEQGYNNIPMGFMCCTSSPSSYMDKIMSLVRSHEGSEEVVTAHLASWDMNPKIKREHFAKEYRDDPVKAERDFGANPPMSENPWFSNLDPVEETLVGRSGRIQYQYQHIRGSAGQNQRYARLVKSRPPEPCPGTILSIDAGYANNSFGAAITAPDGDGNAKVLAVVEIAPVKGQNVLNYTYIMRDLISPLIELFNVKLMVADRWQSIKLLQDVEAEHGIYTDTRSMTADDFNYIYDCIIDDSQLRVSLPKPEISIEEIAQADMEVYPHCFEYQPAAHMYHQFQTATLNRRGIVDKGAGYTDDVLRAACLGLSYALDVEEVERWQILGEVQTVERGAVGTKRALISQSSSLGVKSSIGGISGARSGSALGVRG